MDASRIRITGPLGLHVKGLWSQLSARGYTDLSIANVARLMAHLSRWLARQGLSATDLTTDHIDRFLRHRRRTGYTCWLSRRGVQPILEYLRTVGAALPRNEARTAVPTPLDQIVDRYLDFMRRERAVAPTTASFYERIARAFLPHDGNLRSLSVARVTAFILKESRTYSVAYTKYKVSALRSLLRYLYVQGAIATDLAAAVPAVAGWRLAAMPKDVPPDFIAQLLGSCDRTPRGRRTRAAVLLMVRLGLRAAEVAALRLDDVDWRAGEMLIRGKGGTTDRLPLPTDVGSALAAYVRWSRPRAATRMVFVRVRAPHGALSSNGVKSLLRAACGRAGLPATGTHRLRHTAATQMLRHGASLTEIAQVLRHRHVDTTAIYAKVDRGSLRQLAQAWPGGAQ